MGFEEAGVEGGDVFDERGPATGVPRGFDEVDDDVGGEEDGVVEGVPYADEDVAHLSVAVEVGGGGESVPDHIGDYVEGFEVELGLFAGVSEFGRCHGGMIREVREKWNSRRGTKRTLLGFRL